MQTNLEIKKYLEENGITQAFISRKTGIEPSKLSLVQSAGSNRRFCGAKRTRCGASGLNL